MTKELLKQIGRQLMANAITPNGFSSKFNELREIKTNIQNDIIYSLSPNEQMDIVNSIKK